MIPVMIVDDEFIARVGMRAMVDWTQYGYEVVCEASSGREGIEQFQKYQPKLIFCDINMPDMNGLEMMREIRALSSQTACVILTAYQDFQYAQQAIKLGVVEYVVKATMLTQDIAALLQKLYPTLCADEKNQKTYDGEQQAREALFTALQSGADESGEAYQILQKYFSQNTSFALLYSRMPQDAQGKENKLLCQTVESIMKDVLRSENIAGLVLREQDVFLVVAATECAEEIQRAADKIIIGVQRYLPHGLRIGISTVTDAQKLFTVGYQQSHHAFNRLILHAPCQYLLYQTLVCNRSEAKEKIMCVLTEISQSLLALNYDAAKEKIKQMFQTIVIPAGSLQILHIAQVNLISLFADYLNLQENEELAMLKQMEQCDDIIKHFLRQTDAVAQMQTQFGTHPPAQLHVEH
ncbi:MAG: response regulator, partial [Ruthenibacterium sp.]